MAISLKRGFTSKKVMQISQQLYEGVELGKNGVIVRDRRLVIVDPADDLSITIDSDSETYLPGTEAKLTFKLCKR